ncbi:MAG: hypothetical protein ACRES3_09570, partial [Steroidobacteraceae bacterium]
MPFLRFRPAILVTLLAAILLPGRAAHAGGPLLVRSTGAPFVWSTAAPIAYRTDNGPLSATVAEAAARARVSAMFQVWTDVPSANISFARAGFITDVGAFTDGDVSTGPEFTAVENDCFDGGQSPIVYDVNGAIFIDLGLDETSVLGFAGPCAIDGAQFVSGRAALNGLFQD